MKTTHTRSGEWGSKARKEANRQLRVADRERAIREGVGDLTDEQLADCPVCGSHWFESCDPEDHEYYEIREEDDRAWIIDPLLGYENF